VCRIGQPGDDRAASSTHYINPERTCRRGVQRVHGLSARFLSDKPLFHDVVEDLIEFIGDSPTGCA
jgi:DNA polymerase III epsilon subunit-like protein